MLRARALAVMREAAEHLGGIAGLGLAKQSEFFEFIRDVLVFV